MIRGSGDVDAPIRNFISCNVHSFRNVVVVHYITSGRKRYIIVKRYLWLSKDPLANDLKF